MDAIKSLSVFALSLLIFTVNEVAARKRAEIGRGDPMIRRNANYTSRVLVNQFTQDVSPCYFQPKCACTLDANTHAVQWTLCEVYEEWPAFTAAANLEMSELYLKGNFSLVPARAFEGFRGFHQLVLFVAHYAGSAPLRIDPEAFVPNLPNYLNELVIQYAELQDIPAAIRTLSSLRALNIQRTTLRSLADYSFQAHDQSTHASPRLSTLTMSHCALASIGDWAFSGQEATLQTLDLSYNNLAKYPYKALSGLTQLRQLSFLSNYLSSLPSGAFQSYQNLQLLSLSGNLFKKMPDDAFEGLENAALTILDLSQNQLTSIPSSVKTISKLRLLKMDNNKIGSIEAGAFRNLTSLSTIHLDHNPLTSIAPGAFSGVRNLHSLSLSTTEMKSIDLDIMAGSDITVFNLQSNQLLESVTVRNASQLPLNLILLNISSNPNLHQVSEEMLEALSSRPALVLDLSENHRFHCTCELQWMHRVSPRQLKIDGTLCDNESLTLAAYLDSLDESPQICTRTSSTTGATTLDAGGQLNGAVAQTLTVLLIILPFGIFFVR